MSLVAAIFISLLLYFCIALCFVVPVECCCSAKQHTRHFSIITHGVGMHARLSVHNNVHAFVDFVAFTYY